MARWPDWDVVPVDLLIGYTSGSWWDIAVIRHSPDAPPGYACWPYWPVGTLPLSDSDHDLTGLDAPYVTDSPVGQIGTLSQSTSSLEILMDPGGTLSSSDLAGMLLPAIPIGHIGRWGYCPRLTLLARMARLLLVAPSANLGRCPHRPSRRRYWRDPGGTFPSSDLAGMLLPAILVRPVASGGTEEDWCGSRREEA